MAADLPRKPLLGSDLTDREWLKRVADLLRMICEGCLRSSDGRFFVLRGEEYGELTELTDNLLIVLSSHNKQYFTSRVVRAAIETIEREAHRPLGNIVGVLRDTLRQGAEGGEALCLPEFIEAAEKAILVLERHYKPSLRERAAQITGNREGAKTQGAPTGDDGKPGTPTDPEVRVTTATNRDVKLPNLGPYDRQAYQLWTLQGWKQQRIADELNKEHGTIYSQGQVARMIGRAKRHAEASGLSDLIADPAKPAKAIDPDRLEIGQRTDHRTRSQRTKRDQDTE